MRTRSLCLGVLLFATTITADSTAQCFGNDGLSTGPCCAPSATNLPPFPPMQLGGRGACFNDCSLELQFPTQNVLISTQVLCDYLLVDFSLNSPSFAMPNQVLVAKYARTWLEFPTPGAVTQVWRFVINGDLNYSNVAPSAIGCPVPFSAVAPYNLPVNYFGHLDYALNCATGNWSCAYALTHFCPTDMHAPWSARPIAAASTWAKRTYHLVAPQNFDFTAFCEAPEGQIYGESARHSQLVPGLPYQCLNESPIHGGQLLTAQVLCACVGPSPTPPPSRYVFQTLNFQTACGFGVPQPTTALGGTVPIPGILPTGLCGMVIGRWVQGSVPSFPGDECVTCYLGVLNYTTPCPSPVGSNSFHLIGGDGTTGGFAAQLFDTNVPIIPNPEFMDLANMLVIGSPILPPFTPGYGALFASDEVWSFNTL